MPPFETSSASSKSNKPTERAPESGSRPLSIEAMIENELDVDQTPKALLDVSWMINEPKITAWLELRKNAKEGAQSALEAALIDIYDSLRSQPGMEDKLSNDPKIKGRIVNMVSRMAVNKIAEKSKPSEAYQIMLDSILQMNAKINIETSDSLS